MAHVNICTFAGNVSSREKGLLATMGITVFRNWLIVTVFSFAFTALAYSQPIFAVSYAEQIISEANFTATMTGSWEGNKSYEVVFRCDNCTPTQIAANLSGNAFDYATVVFTAPSAGLVVVTGEATGPDCDPCEATPGPASLIILPIELVEFKAQARSKSIAINWATASELDNQLFVVERSDDGSMFEAIGEVEGSGNSTERKEYQFSDKSPASGLNYYRLKQVDFNGNYEYSPIVTVRFNDEEEITIFPTIVEDNLQIVLPNSVTEYQTLINIYDSLGGLVAQHIGVTEPNLSIPMSTFAPGSYWVVVINGEIEKQGLIIKH